MIAFKAKTLRSSNVLRDDGFGYNVDHEQVLF